MSFELHPRLAAGTHPIAVLNGCHVLLKDNACFPWILIVPEVEEGIEDLHQLDAARYEEVTSLVRTISIFVSEHFSPDKLNVACIGNVVRQMHIHLVGRSESDPAWPGTVWASDVKKPYLPDEIASIRHAARRFLNEELDQDD
ncbi:HIT family protein [Haloferula chungangensis]|uniref:HIT family protein n=1 Tax=Haloferula chungangensis TaxID=1048331 RepID=A0ABW2LAU3_9BACT